jgi:hypothetical protein
MLTEAASVAVLTLRLGAPVALCVAARCCTVGGRESESECLS